jgi:Fe-S-cluster containining protein
MSHGQTSTQTEDGRIFHDLATDNNPCFECGACCYHFRVSFYHGELDSQPGGFVPASLGAPITPFLACMRGTEQGGRCVALAEDGRCTIYLQRPSTCREFPAYLPDDSANPECNRLRTLYKLPPRV